MPQPGLTAPTCLEKENLMNTYSVIAGFAAIVVLSLIMLAKGMMGLMPELDVIAMLGKMAQDIMGPPPRHAKPCFAQTVKL